MKHTAILLPILLAGCTVLGVRSVDEPSFETVQVLENGIGIRHYAPRLAAEAEVEGSGSDAQRRAFRLLFAYISGANSGGEKIAMTALVEEQPAGREIAMTAPVETAATADGLVMRFFLPSGLELETAPQPTDPAVRLAPVAAQDVAVQRFTGWWTEPGLARRKAALVENLASTGWTPIGPPVGWFYDPPWTLPFLRRNEVVVPVERRVVDESAGRG